MKQSLTNNKHTKKIHFPGKMPICKHQQIDFFKDDFQSVLRSLRTLMFINIINGSLDGMRIDAIR